MAADPLTAGLGLADTIISRLWPDKSEQERQQMAAALTIVQGQLDANKAEAASPSACRYGGSQGGLTLSKRSSHNRELGTGEEEEEGVGGVITATQREYRSNKYR